MTESYLFWRSIFPPPAVVASILIIIEDFCLSVVKWFMELECVGHKIFELSQKMRQVIDFQLSHFLRQFDWAKFFVNGNAGFGVGAMLLKAVIGWI